MSPFLSCYPLSVKLSFGTFIIILRIIKVTSYHISSHLSDHVLHCHHCPLIKIRFISDNKMKESNKTKLFGNDFYSAEKKQISNALMEKAEAFIVLQKSRVND